MYIMFHILIDICRINDRIYIGIIQKGKVKDGFLIIKQKYSYHGAEK
jgi:hypothetical protein